MPPPWPCCPLLAGAPGFGLPTPTGAGEARLLPGSLPAVPAGASVEDVTIQGMPFARGRALQHRPLHVLHGTSPKALLYNAGVPRAPTLRLLHPCVAYFLLPFFSVCFAPASLFPGAVAPRGGPWSGVSPGYGPPRAEGRGEQPGILSSQSTAAGKAVGLHPFVVSRAILDRWTDRWTPLL